MTPDRYTFWVVSLTGCVFCGWWLSIRPGSALRNISTPVAFLAIVMAVLLCLLGITGQDMRGYTTDIYQFTFGG